MDFKIIKSIFVSLILNVFILLSMCDNPLDNNNSVDIYVAGYCDIFACYWKNGVKVQLSDEANVAEAKSIVVYGEDIYIAGYEAVYCEKRQGIAWLPYAHGCLPDSL